MKSLSTKLVLSAIAIVAMLASPAFAQKSHRRVSQHQYVTSDPAPQSGRGIYNMVPDYDRYSPGVTGGGSTGYNQMLHDDAW